MSGLTIPAGELPFLKPTSEEDRQYRVVFFVAQMGRHSVKLLKNCLQHCDQPLAEANGHIKRTPLTEKQHQEAVKELMALSIWLTMARQSGSSMEDWLKTFFQESWYAADKLYPEPASKAVLDFYPGSATDEETCQMASVRMCHNLGLGNTVDDAIIFIANEIMQADEERLRILHDALFQTTEEMIKLVDVPM